MIRKPDEGDFRESRAVAGIRDARSLALEGAKGIGEGAQSFVRRALGTLFLFGFGMSLIAHVGPVALLVAMGGGLTWFLSWNGKRSRQAAMDRAIRWGEPTSLHPVAAIAAAPLSPVRYELSAGVAGRAAAKIAVPAILMFPTTAMLQYMLPFMLAGVTMFALALLIVAKLFGDRTLLTYDAETITAKGLLGEGTMLWADVVDVTVRKVSWWNLRTIFTSGAKRNLVVIGRFNRLGGPDTLYIPIPLLGLDTPGLTRLVSQMLMLRAGAPVQAITPYPAATPMAPAVPTAMPIPAPLPPVAARADGAFDPDAIMARYMAEREALIAQQRPDLAAPASAPTPGFAPASRSTFGRKRVGQPVGQ